MGEEAVFAIATTITSQEMVAGCGRIVTEAASSTKLAVTFPEIFAWLPAQRVSERFLDGACRLLTAVLRPW